MKSEPDFVGSDALNIELEHFRAQNRDYTFVENALEAGGV